MIVMRIAITPSLNASIRLLVIGPLSLRGQVWHGPGRASCETRARSATIAPSMPEELSPSQAARRIGATTRTVQRWIALGRLPARRLGGRWRVASDALDAFARAPEPSDGGPTMQPQTSPARAGLPGGADAGPVPMRVLFVANRGEIA